MATLKEQIAEAEKELYLKRCAVEVHELYVKGLKLLHQCHHEFTRPMVGYEHEGGECIYCGINQVYAESQKIGAQYK